MQRIKTATWGMLFASICAIAAGCGTDDAGAGGGAGGAGPVGGAGGSGGSEVSDAAGGGDASGTGGTGGSAGGGGTQQLDAGPDAPAVETELVHMVGRFDGTDPSRPKSSWSGTSFATRLSGSDLSVRLGGASDVYFEVDIDGQSAGRFKTTTGGDQSYAVASGLGAGEHDVMIVRRNEGFFGDVEFLGFEPGAGATLVETPRPYVHKMELIGDSLTAGYGIEGADANCNFSGDTESFYGTYGFIAARNVGAEAHAIAYSGKGVFQNYGGDKTEPMGELWPRTLTNDPSSQWDFSRFEPEAVVVNLGTNDFSAPLGESDFVGAYAAFLGQVRSHYPAAMIFCVTWADWGATNEAWVEEAMSQTGDANLRHVQFSVDPADGYGCDWHTNLVTNAKLALVLTQALQTELGW